jgi:hypothetical protein
LTGSIAGLDSAGSETSDTIGDGEAAFICEDGLRFEEHEYKIAAPIKTAAATYVRGFMVYSPITVQANQCDILHKLKAQTAGKSAHPTAKFLQARRGSGYELNGMAKS